MNYAKKTRQVATKYPLNLADYETAIYFQLLGFRPLRRTYAGDGPPVFRGTAAKRLLGGSQDQS